MFNVRVYIFHLTVPSFAHLFDDDGVHIINCYCAKKNQPIIELIIKELNSYIKLPNSPKLLPHQFWYVLKCLQIAIYFCVRDIWWETIELSPIQHLHFSSSKIYKRIFSPQIYLSTIYKCIYICRFPCLNCYRELIQ